MYSFSAWACLSLSFTHLLTHLNSPPFSLFIPLPLSRHVYICLCVCLSICVSPCPFLPLHICLYIYYVLLVHVCVCMTGLLTSFYRIVTPLPHQPPRDRCQSVFSVSAPCVCTSGGFINGFTTRSLISSDRWVSAPRFIHRLVCIAIVMETPWARPAGFLRPVKSAPSFLPPGHFISL